MEQPVSFGVLIQAPPEQVWEAISTEAGQQRWLMRAAFTAREEAPLRHLAFEQGRKSVYLGEVLEVVPGRRLVFTWQAVTPADWGARTLVSFTLRPEGQGTHVSVQHTGWASVALRLRTAARQGAAAGWPEALTDLRSLLEGQPRRACLLITLEAAAAEVFGALTRPDVLRRWFPHRLVAWEPERGRRLGLDLRRDPGGTLYRMEGKVLRRVENELFAYTWQLDGWPGPSVVAYALDEGATGCRLFIDHSNFDGFAERERTRAVSQMQSGWEQAAALLRLHLEGDRSAIHAG